MSYFAGQVSHVLVNRASNQGAQTLLRSSDELFTVSDDLVRGIKPKSEYDVTTLYRGLTGSEGAGPAIFLTDDAAVAATYAKDGLDVASYQLSQQGLEALREAGKLELLTGVHGTGVVSREFKFIGPSLREAVNSYAK